jgi:hypothetical protein
VDEDGGDGARTLAGSNRTGEPNMSLLVLGLPPGAQVGVFASRRTVVEQTFLSVTGRADFTGRIGLSIPRDDPETPQSEGLQDGDSIVIKFCPSASSGLTHWDNLPAPRMTWLEGSPEYRADGFAVARLDMAPLPQTLGDLACLPNPFNDRFLIRFKSGSGEATSIKVYDVSGRLLHGELIPPAEVETYRETAVNARTLPAGLLFIRAVEGSRERAVKVVHLP